MTCESGDAVARYGSAQSSPTTLIPLFGESIGRCIGISLDLSRLARVSHEWNDSIARRQLVNRHDLLIQVWDFGSYFNLIFDMVRCTMSPTNSQPNYRYSDQRFIIPSHIVPISFNDARVQAALSAIERRPMGRVVMIARIEDGPAKGDIYKVCVLRQTGHVRVAVLPVGDMQFIDCPIPNHPDCHFPPLSAAVITVEGTPRVILIGHRYAHGLDSDGDADYETGICLLLNPADRQFTRIPFPPQYCRRHYNSAVVFKGDFIFCSSTTADAIAEPDGLPLRPYRLTCNPASHAIPFEWIPLPILNAPSHYQRELKLVEMDNQLLAIVYSRSIYVFNQPFNQWTHLWTDQDHHTRFYYDCMPVPHSLFE